jgi:hypothetical protein
VDRYIDPTKTEEMLPPNVIETQTSGSVKRFGVKLRYNGCPLRIGSAYCTPEDANKVVCVFRDCIQADSEGNLFFAPYVLKKYKDLYVNRYLPFTTKKNCIQVVNYLSKWLRDWKKKKTTGKKKKKKRKSKNKRVDARVHVGKAKTTDFRESFFKFAAAVENTSGNNKQLLKQVENEVLDPAIDKMTNIVSGALSANGLNQMGERSNDGYTVHGWQNHSLEVLFTVKRLLNLNNNVPLNSGPSSSQSSSTEDAENDSNSPSFASDADNFEHLDDSLGYLNNGHDFVSYFDVVSELRIESLVPNSIVKYATEQHNPNCYSLITINGIWDNNFTLHGALQKINGETGLVLEEKTMDILSQSGSNGTTANFMVDLNDCEISKYKFKLIARDLLLSKTVESNEVDFEIKGAAHSSNKGLKMSKNKNGDNSGDNGSNNDNNNNFYGSNNNSSSDDYKRYEFKKNESSGPNGNKRGKQQDALSTDIELGTSKSNLADLLPKEALPLLKFSKKFGNALVMPISILLVALCFPNSTRGSTFKTDQHLQSSYSFVEKIGITDLSIRACSVFTDEAICSDKISYLSTNSFGSPLEYGLDDYYVKVRDSMPFASRFGSFVALLLPLSSYFLLLNYFNRPYERDRMSSQCTIFLTIAEILYYFFEGYSMIFSLCPLVSIVLIYAMEGFISRFWSVATYAKYRLEYHIFYTFVLFLCHLTIRPWVVKHYGHSIITDLPIVTTTFAPVCQRMFGQNLPVLIAVKKGPVLLKWLPCLAIFSLILSFATATSINNLNAQTIFQLWPYYFAPYFVAFSVATVIKCLRIPTLLQFVLEENSQFLEWYC